MAEPNRAERWRQQVRIRECWRVADLRAAPVLALLGITPSARLPRLRLEFTAIAVNALLPSTATLWASNVFHGRGVDDDRLTVNRLDRHADWQGVGFKANERAPLRPTRIFDL